MACQMNKVIEYMLTNKPNWVITKQLKEILDTENEVKEYGNSNENFDKNLDTKLRDTLTKLYPEIKLEYTEDEIQYIDSNGNVMNQEEANNLVKYALKVVDTLYDIGTPKNSKHGGNSQPVRSTIKLNSKENPNIEVNLTKYLAGKGVSKEQIEYMFEYMRQNSIQEINTVDLAEKLMLGLVQNVELSTSTFTPIKKPYFGGKEYFPNSFEHLMAQGPHTTTKKVTQIVDNDEYVIDKSSIFGPLQYKYYINEKLVSKEEFKSKLNSKTTLTKNSTYYKDLAVPGGTNYKEIEISTPSVKAALKGHADFATDEGIGWYRVDTEVIGQEVIEMPNSFTDKTNTKWEKEDGVWYLTYPNEVPTKRDDLSDAEARRTYYEIDTKINNNNTTGTPTKTLRVLEMQSDMFQKMKDKDLSSSTTTQTSLNKAFHQILNTDNKWIRFFIKSIVQNAQRNGYEKIRFPSGETAAKVEGHDTLVDIIRKKEKVLNNIEKAIIKNTEQLVQAKKDNNKYKIDLHTDKLVTLNEEKTTLTKALKENNIAQLAPIEGFYQVRVQNTLKKEYGTDKVKTVTDEHGNKWFELELDSKRDSQAIMLQQQGGKIKGQANIEAGTVLINSLLQSQDTLPHEYAHHYIAWFRDTPIVQEAIKKWGSEEALVQAIGEQAVKQKGEAYGWWKKFTQWLQDIFDSQSDKSKESIKNLLTDSFLTRQNLKETSTYTVYPKAKPDMVKAKYKASKATKYIGYGKAGSSTALYAKQLSEQGMPVNAGKYDEKDVVFVSVNGTPNREDYVNTLKQVIAALESGATVLTDSESYLSKSTYNKGEIQLAKNLMNRGYTRITADEMQDVGVWVKKIDEGKADTQEEVGKIDSVQSAEDKTVSNIKEVSKQANTIIDSIKYVEDALKVSLDARSRELLSKITDKNVLDKIIENVKCTRGL